MKCKGCDNTLMTGVKRETIDEKTGYCFECRKKSFGFDNPMEYGKTTHTEMKDRKTCNVLGISAAEFNAEVK